MQNGFNKFTVLSALFLILSIVSTQTLWSINVPPAICPASTTAALGQVVVLKSQVDDTSFEMSTSLLPILDTVQNLLEGADIGLFEKEYKGRLIIPINLAGPILREIIQAAKLVAGHPRDLTKGRAIDTLTNDLSNHTQIFTLAYPKRLEVLKAANYLGFELLFETLLQNLARDSVYRPDHLKNIENLSPEDQKKRWDEVRKFVPGGVFWPEELARQYFLINGRNLPDELIDHNSYGFSVAELIDAGRIEVEGEAIEDHITGPELCLENLRINNLEGLEKVSGLAEINRANLKGNHLREIKAGQLSKLINVITILLDNNRLSSFEPDALAGLKSLSAIILSGNPLSKEQVEKLRRAYPKLSITN